MTLPSNKISSKISFILFLVLCLYICVFVWGRGVGDWLPDHSIVYEIMAQRKSQKESWSGISGSSSVPPTSSVTLLSLSFSLCFYRIGTSVVRWVIKPGYHLSSLITPQEVSKYPGIIDGKMETKGRKYAKKESSYVLFYFFITNCPSSKLCG